MAIYRLNVLGKGGGHIVILHVHIRTLVYKNDYKRHVT